MDILVIVASIILELFQIIIRQKSNSILELFFFGSVCILL
jgi:hypothetical protein